MESYYEHIALKYECQELRWSLGRAKAEVEDLRRQLAEYQTKLDEFARNGRILSGMLDRAVAERDDALAEIAKAQRDRQVLSRMLKRKIDGDDDSAEIETKYRRMESFCAVHGGGGEIVTDEELKAIEDIEAVASPGSWVIRPWQGMCECGENHDSQEQCKDWYWSQVGEIQGPKLIDLGDYDAICQSDLEFIACARDAVPALLAEVRWLRAELSWKIGEAREAATELEKSESILRAVRREITDETFNRLIDSVNLGRIENYPLPPVSDDAKWQGCYDGEVHLD